jgi:hypothetical protein
MCLRTERTKKKRKEKKKKKEKTRNNITTNLQRARTGSRGQLQAAGGGERQLLVRTFENRANEEKTEEKKKRTEKRKN